MQTERHISIIMLGQQEEINTHGVSRKHNYCLGSTRHLSCCVTFLFGPKLLAYIILNHHSLSAFIYRNKKIIVLSNYKQIAVQQLPATVWVKLKTINVFSCLLSKNLSSSLLWWNCHGAYIWKLKRVEITVRFQIRAYKIVFLLAPLYWN